MCIQAHKHDYAFFGGVSTVFISISKGLVFENWLTTSATNGVSHYQSLEMSKLKPLGDTITYPGGQLLPKRQAIQSVGESVEKPGHSYTAGGNVKWHSHCGKQLASFL